MSITIRSTCFFLKDFTVLDFTITPFCFFNITNPLCFFQRFHCNEHYDTICFVSFRDLTVMNITIQSLGFFQGLHRREHFSTTCFIFFSSKRLPSVGLSNKNVVFSRLVGCVEAERLTWSKELANCFLDFCCKVVVVVVHQYHETFWSGYIFKLYRFCVHGYRVQVKLQWQCVVFWFKKKALHLQLWTFFVLEVLINCLLIYSFCAV